MISGARLAALFALWTTLQQCNADTTSVFIAADFVWWNYVPSGSNRCQDDTGDLSDPSTLYTSAGVGPRYLKALYHEYTDATFQTISPTSSAEEHLGTLGPRLFAIPGDVLNIVFRNNLNYTVNVVPSGAVTNSTEVAEPGQTITYQWTIGVQALPAKKETATSQLWLYRSTVDFEGDANAGLIGPLIVTNPAYALPSKQPSDVAQTFVALFQIMNENASPLLPYTLAALGLNDTAGLSEDDFIESNLKHSINGFIFCNTPGFTMALGATVRWHVVTEGNEADIHNAHFHGNTLLMNGHRIDQMGLLAGSVQTADMLCDDPGIWFFHCHINDHIAAGMKTFYTVSPNGLIQAGAGEVPGGVTRQYYMTAERELWNHIPLGVNACDGTLQPLDGEGAARAFNNASTNTVGSARFRATFYEYTDATFTTRKERAAEDAYLGDLGPIFRATVGDTINVTFLNKIERALSVHPHGVFYTKANEGALYADGTSGADKRDDAVRLGETYTYTWHVRERSGPGPKDPSSVIWIYHSHHSEVQDTNTGLYGAMIISAQGKARPDGSPKDIDKEFVLMYSIAHERKSFFALGNYLKFLPQLVNTLPKKRALVDELAGDDSYDYEDLYYMINGESYCNLPQLAASQGQRARFHIFTLGTEDDLHGPNIAATTFVDNYQRKEALQFIPGRMHQQDAVLDQAGTWLVQCRTTNHFDAGMDALLNVTAAPHDVGDAPSAGAANVTYFIQAERVLHDFAPGGVVDQCTGLPLEGELSIYADPDGPGLAGLLSKALYREYTDSTFTQQVPAPAQHGILGPIVHARIGDIITIVFKNALPFSANLQLGGGFQLLYPAEQGGAVEPGQSQTYVWQVPPTLGPGKQDFSTVAYTYRSTVDPTAHENAGLIGAVVIGRLKATLDAYVEFPLLFNIQNEGLSAFYQDNVAARQAALGRKLNQKGANFIEANKKHSVNGFIFCNMPEVSVPQDAHVRFVLIGIGGETDMHTPGFTNHLQQTAEGSGYVVELFPGAARISNLLADQPGRWLFRCNVQDHNTAGMKAVLAVTPRNGQLNDTEPVMS